MQYRMRTFLFGIEIYEVFNINVLCYDDGRNNKSLG
jgi:hypothetical protein